MRLASVIAVTILGVAGCSSTPTYGSTGGQNGPGPNQVFMQGSAFNPASRTVNVGTTVTWINQDAYAHTVNKSSGPGASFASGNIAAGAQYQVKFDSVGTYQYYCSIHGSPGAGMHGTIVVQ